jgi:tetratricopeptide (TPR) repeat protein
MMPRQQTWAVAVTVAMLLGATAALQARLERARPETTNRPGFLYIDSPGLAQRLALSYDSLLADIYWIRTIQHYGSVRLSKSTDKRYDLLRPLLDLTTSLDPNFRAAYLYGAIFLAEPHPSGAGRPQDAVGLLEKAMEAQPDYWVYAQQIGFIYYWYLRDFRKAAGWFGRASRMPDAPDWLKPLEALTLAQGGDRATSRRLWTQILDSDSDLLHESARLRLSQLDALDAIDGLEALVRRFTERTGRTAAHWDDLIAAGWLRGLPYDPAGVPFVLELGGDVTLSPHSPLNPLPVEPPSLAP